MGLTAFTKKPTTPKVETKKTETLDSVLVAKNFYRVRDAYAIKLYGQDEGMSFDVSGQRLFGSNIAIKDGLLFGSSLGDLTIEAYFQGEVSYLLEATQKLPVDKNRIKANHYSQDIVLNKVWTSLEGQETSNSIITQFQDKTLLKYIKEIHLFFSSDASVDRVKLIEPTDDYTEITFTHKQFNTPIDDSVFAL